MLNDRAYYETLTGSLEEALVRSTAMQVVAQRHGLPMLVGRLDTIGRVLMELGHLEDAEAAMLPGLRPEALQASLDGDAGADFLLTLTGIRRRRGSVDAAQETLDECVRRCEAHGLTSIRVRARGEQADLHAAGGDFRAAFEQHKLYSAELMDLRSDERDAGRARCLDHFKRINDTCSHEAGDQVLRIVRTARPADAHLYAAKRDGRDRVVTDGGGTDSGDTDPR